MKKLTNISKKLDTLFKILQKLIRITLALSIVIAVVLTLLNIFFPDMVIGEDFHALTLGALTLELSQALTPSNQTILIYLWSLLVPGFFSALLIDYALGLVRKILHPMTEGRPFDQSVGVNIKKIGYVSLILGIVGNIGSMIETALAVKAFNLSHLPDSSAIVSITANYTFDLSFLAVFFLLILLSYIFRYGAELQQLSDETL